MKFILILFVILVSVPLITGQVCEEGETEDCTPNVGICTGSTRTCYTGIWGSCSILPQEEICDNFLDDDCDGKVDEECVCSEGEQRPCPLWNLGVCSASVQTCGNNSWSDCNISPVNETCDNRVDDDCDGKTDMEDDDCFDENHCTNRKKDYDEEDVDCGGDLCEICPTCTDGKLSSRLGELKVGVILENGIISDCGGLCPVCPTCSDGKKNQGEEKADCGGPCPNCEIEVLEQEQNTYCGDGICDQTEDSEFCPEDCIPDSNFFLYFFVLLIFLILLFLAIFILTFRFGKKKNKQQPIKIHPAFLQSLPKNYKTEQLADKLKKIK